MSEINHNNPVDVGGQLRRLRSQVDVLTHDRDAWMQEAANRSLTIGAVEGERDLARQQRDDAERRLQAARDLLNETAKQLQETAAHLVDRLAGNPAEDVTMASQLEELAEALETGAQS